MRRTLVATLTALALAGAFFMPVAAAPPDWGNTRCNPGHPCISPKPSVAPSPTTTPAPTATPQPTATAAPTPKPTPSATDSLSLPVRAAFYYPWFPEAWNQQGLNPFTHYTPSLGFYDTSAVVGQQVAAMQSAGLQAGIASWWGQGTATDGRIPTLLANAGTFRWALYYEPEGQGDPTVAQISTDLGYIAANYGSQPGYLRVGDKPVLFVYADALDACPMSDRWAQANAGRFYVVLKVFAGYRTCVSQPDSWHQYAPAVAEDHQTGFSFSISPGFWKANESTPRLARDANRWATNVADMEGSGEPWQLVTTWNEWGEGTQVEDSTELGTTYRDVLAGTTPVPSATARATSTPTSTPTPPSPSPTTSPSASPSATPSGITHTIVVWLENHEATAVTATSMPYLYGLGHTYGRADAYYAVTHPSLPNYLAFWSGSTQGVTDDGTYNLSAASLSTQMQAAGRSWRTYAQDYPSTTGCHTASTYSGTGDGPQNTTSGTYARKHVPAMSFTLNGGANCADIQPLAAFDPSVNVAFVVPNLCNDAHDCSLATADSFLRAFVPSVLNAPDFAHTLLVITWDEGSTNTNGGGRVFTAVVRPGLSGFVSTTTHNHYSLLRTIEDLNGLGHLGAAGSANTLSEFLP